MNKPIPAIDENGEFVVATQRNGEQVIIYTLHSDADQIVGECRWWHLDGSSICRSKPGYDLIDLDKVRATVERAPKARDFSGLWEPKPKVHYDADGAASTDSRSAAEAVLRNHVPRAPARPSFAEALETEMHNEPLLCDGPMFRAVQRARRASEGL